MAGLAATKTAGRRNNATTTIITKKIENIECFACRKKGLFRPNFPEKKNSGGSPGGSSGPTPIGAMMAVTSSPKAGHTLQKRNRVEDFWAWDTGSTDHITSDKTGMKNFDKSRN